MEILNVETRYKEIFNLSDEILNILPKKVILFTTVQYFNSLENIKKQLSDNNIEVVLLKPRRCYYQGQILGCSNVKINEDGDFLYFGDGVFHPKALLLKNDKIVFCFNPISKEIKKYDQEYVKNMLSRIKGKYVKFLSFKKIGVLLTTKFGQRKEELIKDLNERFPDKKFYYFYDNTYDFNSLSNFNFIEMFLNTMCERIGHDDSFEQNLSILNLEDLNEISSLD